MSQGLPIGITRLAQCCQSVITKDGFFYPNLTRIMDNFSCAPLNTLFHNGKTCNRLSENPKFDVMRHGGLILTLQWRHGLMCGQRGDDVRLFVF